MDTKDEEKTRVQLDMPCICSKEGKQDAKESRERAAKLMGILPDSQSYITCIVMELEWNYQTSITMVAADQWCGVSAESKDEKIFVPCDLVEDGFTEIYLYLHDKKESTGEIPAQAEV